MQKRSQREAVRVFVWVQMSGEGEERHVISFVDESPTLNILKIEIGVALDVLVMHFSRKEQLEHKHAQLQISHWISLQAVCNFQNRGWP